MAAAKTNQKHTSKQLGNLSNIDGEEDISFCYFCSKKAQFRCGICLEATYCTAEHQKADWPSHKRRCIRPEDKLKQLYRHLQNYKKTFFDKLSKRLTNECENICDNILKISEEIVTKFPSTKHEIEYGTAICCYVKMLLAVKSFNEAQEILNNYLKERDGFLRDTSNIPSNLKPEDPNYVSILFFVEGKLKLLSVLSNLTHQAVRNSVYMIEILLRHCEKFYGPDSLEVSNVYFELGNYFYFMNQNMKACACFLVAGNKRKQKGVSSYYNAAIILMQNNSFNKAHKFLLKCLQMIENAGDHKGIIDRVYLALAFCYKKLNHFDNTVHYLERALCQVSTKKRFNNQQQNHIKDLLRTLSQEYKKQFNNDQIINLPREKIASDPHVVISNQNFEDFWDLDVNNAKQKKADEWIKSFKNETEKTKFESKIPMTNNLVEKVLFVNNFTDDKNEQAVSARASKSATSMDYINVDLEFMSKLTATQVRFMNELNRLLVINKDKPTIFDVIENSNLLQELSKQKTQRFYQLNPELVRQKQDYNLMDEDEAPNNELEQSKGPDIKAYALLKSAEIQKIKPLKAPKLDLTKALKKQ